MTKPTSRAHRGRQSKIQNSVTTTPIHKPNAALFSAFMASLLYVPEHSTVLRVSNPWSLAQARCRANPGSVLVFGQAEVLGLATSHWWTLSPLGIISDPYEAENYQPQVELTPASRWVWDAGSGKDTFKVDIGRYKSMDPKYLEWVFTYLVRHRGWVRGKCGNATTEMVTTFPELRRQPGFVTCNWGRDQHWWCLDPDGIIVDPTANQFQGKIFYDPVDLNDPADIIRIPIGICAYCGEDILPSSEIRDTVCSRHCYHAFMKSLVL